MQGRQERTLVPGAISLISTMMTLWLIAGLRESPFIWLPSVQTNSDKLLSPILIFLASVAVGNYGIGHVCQAILMGFTFLCYRTRFVDPKRLIDTFNVPVEFKRRIFSKALREPLLAEVHLRLHTRARQSLIDHCSRRNSGWYINSSSAIAFF